VLNSDDERDAVAAPPDLDVAPPARRTEDVARASAPSDARIDALIAAWSGLDGRARRAAPQRRATRPRLTFAPGSSGLAARGLSSARRIGCVPVAQLDRALVS
jgi:hypothetical protein